MNKQRSKTYKDNIKYIELMLQFKINTLSDEEYLDCIDNLCKKFEDAGEKTWEHSEIRKAFSVFDRFQTVALLEIDYKGKGLDKEQRYVPICQYLLLTCFDQLGQPNDWMPFQCWLTSKKKKGERELIISRLSNTLNPIDISKFLFEEYNKIYGVRNSFFRFIYEVLPQPVMGYLLDAVRVIKIPNPFESYDQQEFLIDKHADYLYKIRNDFTHNTYYTGPLMFAENEVFEGFANFKGLNSEDGFSSISGWRIREEIAKSTYTIVYLNHTTFYERLKKSVIAGLTEFIRVNGQII